MDSNRAALRAARPLGLALLPLAAVALFIAAPLWALLTEGLQPASWDTLVAGSTWRVMGYTTAQALVSTALSIGLALPVAFALYRLSIPGRRIWLALITIPFVLPTVVVGLAFRELLPFAGTTWAIIVAHVFFNVGLAVRVIGAVWGQLDGRLGEVAASLGASAFARFRLITWPLLRPAITAASVLVFMFTFTSFGVVLVVGDPALPTIEVEIYQRAIQRLDLDAAAALAILQLVVVVFTLGLASRLQQRLSVVGVVADVSRRERPRGTGDYLAVSIAVFVAVAVILPIAQLVATSLQVGDSWGLTWYAEAFAPSDNTTRATPVSKALWISARYAVVATMIALVLGMLAAISVTHLKRGQATLDTIVTLPLGISAVSIGLGLLLLSIGGPLDLRGWWLLVPLGQALVAMPIVVRVVLPVLRSIDPRLRDVAASLGARPIRVWLTVDGPLALRAAAVAGALSAAVSLGEFGATAFLARADTPTVPVQIVRLLSRPGEANLGQAAVLSVILVIVTATVVGVAERARPSKSTGW